MALENMEPFFLVVGLNANGDVISNMMKKADTREKAEIWATAQMVNHHQMVAFAAVPVLHITTRTTPALKMVVLEPAVMQEAPKSRRFGDEGFPEGKPSYGGKSP